MTARRRAATRRFALNERDHGGPLGRTATQRHEESPTSRRRHGQHRLVPGQGGGTATEPDFPTDFATANSSIEESPQIAEAGHPPATVSKTCSSRGASS